MSKIFRRGGQSSTHQLKETVKRLLRRGGSKDLQAVKGKSVAITSGKGGVGKTITAANLAIYYAKKGLRTALVDLDPLSDIAALLDLVEAEIALEEQGSQPGGRRIDDYLRPIFGKLDLLFPAQKLKAVDRATLLPTIYDELVQQLNQRYEILVFDLPAGSEFEDNLVFLPFMGMILLVTNPEPTAHAAAGAYIKQLFDTYEELPVYLWHNRYSPNMRTGFNPKDVVGNYNRNVAAELRIDGKVRGRVLDFASVPEDPALNLLRGTPDADVNILRFILDTLQYMHEERVAGLAAANISSRSFELIQYFLAHHKNIDDVDAYLEEIGRYLRQLLETRTASEAENGALERGTGVEVFAPEEKLGFRGFLQALRSDPIRSRVARIVELLEEKLQRLEEESGPFSTGTAAAQDKALDRELSSLLVDVETAGQREPLLVNQGGLLLFYFSLYKLFRSETVVELIRSLIPMRKNRKGAPVRDRHRQIRNLVEGNPGYKNSYLRLLKTLHPVVSKQIGNIVKVFDLSSLLFRDAKGQIIRSAYVKLLTNFLHDTLYSGLSVVIGFPFRSAAAVFQEGAEKVLAVLQRREQG